MTPAPSSSGTLCGVLARQAMRQAEAPALQFGERTWRYGELAREVDRVAALLHGRWGVRAGDRLAWLGLNHPAQLLLLFASARLGAILLSLNARLAAAEWDTALDDCAPGCLVHDAACAEPAQALADRHGLAVHAASELDEAGGAGEAPQAGADASAPVLLVYTSGTGGRPRAAVHTQANLLANMRAAAQVQAMTPGDRILTVLPLFHVGGLCIQTLPALWAGACVLLHPRFDAGAVLEAIDRNRPTLTLQVPATLKALCEHPAWPGADLSSLRAVWAGSSLLPGPLVRVFHARGLPVCNVYGATETGPFSLALPPAHAFDQVGSCGWPAPGVEVRLAPAERAGPGAAGAASGELWIRGPAVVRRYWPDLPACDAEGWFHSGDLATRSPDGSYTVVGRARELIITGGENIHPAEIEGPLAEHPAVAECAAFGLPDPRWGELVAAVVVLRPGAEVSDNALQAHLAARLARYKLPRRWLRVEALPRTALGKVQRHLLAALAGSGVSSDEKVGPF